MRENKYNILFLDIEKKIIENIWEEGHSLPTEYELCDIYDVKRSTVREAIRSLEEGQLVKRYGKKLVINRLSIDEYVSHNINKIKLLNVSFNEVFDFFVQFYPYVIEYSCDNFMKIMRSDEQQKKWADILQFHTNLKNKHVKYLKLRGGIFAKKEEYETELLEIKNEINEFTIHFLDNLADFLQNRFIKIQFKSSLKILGPLFQLIIDNITSEHVIENFENILFSFGKRQKILTQKYFHQTFDLFISESKNLDLDFNLPIIEISTHIEKLKEQS